MSEIEKIQRYIERTKMNVSKAYSMNVLKGFELSKLVYEASDIPLEIILLAFDYGRAKGYRAAKAEACRG